MITGIKWPTSDVHPATSRTDTLLFLCFFDPNTVSTVPETIAYLQQLSRFTLSVVNLAENRIDTGFLKIPSDIDLDGFAAIVIHNSVSYNVDNLKSLDALTERRLADYAGPKILFKQDENFRHREIAEYVGRTGFDLIFTCLPESEWQKIYPRELAGDPRFVRMLTGYVTATHRALNVRDVARSIDIGYRGSIQPLSFGRLAWEKRKIGDDVRRLLRDRDFVLDISSRWEDRIGGGGWLKFLATCKATLGAESGASVFDLDGSLAERLREVKDPYGIRYDDVNHIESVLAKLQDLEGNVNYAQLSPRHFEAAATRTLQLLYPGAYSGILKPGQHYFELARDYSNLDEGVEVLLDDMRRRRFTDAAFEEVILDRRNWIESFVEQFDSEVARALAENARFPSRVPRTRIPTQRNVLLLVVQESEREPRWDWIVSKSPPGVLVHQLGISYRSARLSNTTRSFRGGLIWSFHKMRVLSNTGILHHLVSSKQVLPGFAILLLLHAITSLRKNAFSRMLGAPQNFPRQDCVRNELRSMMEIAMTAVYHATKLRGIHAIVATNLDTLAAAIALKEIWGVPIVYDISEFRAGAASGREKPERDLWRRLEERLLTGVDYFQAASIELIGAMSDAYGISLGYVPSTPPLSKAIAKASLRHPEAVAGEACRFCYQGTFEKSNGIELLIKVWPKTCPAAVLELRGPKSQYKRKMMRLAQSVGLLGSRIVFSGMFSVRGLAEGSALVDVGIVSNSPLGVNETACVSREVAQYLAVGLPILANKTTFTKQIIAEADCGEVVDFCDEQMLIMAVDRLANDSKRRREQGARADTYFRGVFHWEVVSKEFYAKLANLVDGFQPARIVESDVSLFPSRDFRSYVPPWRATLRYVRRIMWSLGLRFWRLLPTELRRHVGNRIRRRFQI